MAAHQDKRTDNWASPKHLHHCAQRYAKVQKRDEISALPKEEPSSGNSKPVKHVKEEEAMGSVIHQNITKFASQPDLPPPQTSTATKPTATQTSDCGGRALAAAVALHSKEILAGAPEGAARYPADP